MKKTTTSLLNYQIWNECFFFFFWVTLHTNRNDFFFGTWSVVSGAIFFLASFIHFYLLIERERERLLPNQNERKRERILTLLLFCKNVYMCISVVFELELMPDERMAPNNNIEDEKKIMYHLYIKQNTSEKIDRKNIFLLLDSLDHIILFHPIKFFPTISCVWTFQTEYKHTHQHIILQWQFYEELYSI